MQQLPLGVRLADHATFETYHVGPNAAALAQLRALAEGGVEAPSLFLAGPPGSGKSHLLQAVCARAPAARAAGSGSPPVPCGYLSLERLAPEHLADALEGWTRLALVALDDVEAVLGNRAAETALLRLYNGLCASGGWLLLAARRPLVRLDLALPDLASRLQAGLQAALAAPADEDLVAALTLRARARGLELPAATADWLMRRCRRDMHSLCTLLDGLDEASLVAQRRLTVPFVRDMLRRRQAAALQRLT